MNNYVIVGYCLTYIPFYKEIIAENESKAMQEVKEYMQVKANVPAERVTIDKVIEIPNEDLPNVN